MSSARLRAGPMPGRSSRIDVGHRAVAARAVVGDREAVRLVAHALQQLQRRACRGRARSARGGPGRRPPRCAWPARSRSTPRSRKPSSARRPAASWPGPPSMTMRFGSVAKDSLRLGSCGLTGPAGSPTARGAAPSTSSIAAKSSGTPSSRPRIVEAPVVGLLRRAALEDDHRGDRVRAHEVGDVEALDAQRQRVEPERLLQAVERLDALLAAALGLQASPGRARAARCARRARGSGACRRARPRGPRRGAPRRSAERLAERLARPRPRSGR